MNKETNVKTQGIPAKMYRTADRITVAAPMPGLEPQNISVEIGAGPSVTLHGEVRGLLKDDKDVLMDEWTPGPYHRELDLPSQVDGERANVTYNNGVVVVVLPVAQKTRPAHLAMNVVSATHGQRTGHSGHETPAAGAAATDANRGRLK